MAKTTAGLEESMSLWAIIHLGFLFVLLIVIISCILFWLSTGILLGAQMVGKAFLPEAYFSYLISTMVIIIAVLLISYNDFVRYLESSPVKWLKTRTLGQMIKVVLLTFVIMWHIPILLGMVISTRIQMGFGLF